MSVLRGAVRTGALLSAAAVAADAVPPVRKPTLGDRIATGVLRFGIFIWKMAAIAVLCAVLFGCVWLISAVTGSHAP